jgi:hypothetical protein
MQEDGSWKCKHGDEECAGDLQQLCVQQYSKDYNRCNRLMNVVLCDWLMHFILRSTVPLLCLLTGTTGS